MANEPNSPSIQVHHGDTEIAEKDANPSIQQLYVPFSVSSVSRWWISPAWTQAPGRLAVANEANLSDWGLEIADWGLAAVGSRERQTNPIGRGPGDCFATLAMTVVEPKVAWGGRAKRSQFAGPVAPNEANFRAGEARTGVFHAKRSQFCGRRRFGGRGGAGLEKVRESRAALAYDAGVAVLLYTQVD